MGTSCLPIDLTVVGAPPHPMSKPLPFSPLHTYPHISTPFHTLNPRPPHSQSPGGPFPNAHPMSLPPDLTCCAADGRPRCPHRQRRKTPARRPPSRQRQGHRPAGVRACAAWLPRLRPPLQPPPAALLVGQGHGRGEGGLRGETGCCLHVRGCLGSW